MNSINKSSKDQADLFPISVSNSPNSSFHEQEEIQPEITVNSNLEGITEVKNESGSWSKRVYLHALDLTPFRGSDQLTVI